MENNITSKFGFGKLSKRLEIVYTGKNLTLPKDVQSAVDDYWGKILRTGKKLYRGEVFQVVNIFENDSSLKFNVVLSDFAHYLYSLHKNMSGKYAFRNVHTSCLIETINDTFIFGAMGKNTSMEGNVQCVGGGLDFDDLSGKRLDLDHNIQKELMEEVGIDVKNKNLVKSLKLEYINFSKHPKAIAAIFILKLKITAADFQKNYEKFEKSLKKKRQLPEFGKMIYLKKNKNEVVKFLKGRKIEGYLEPLLKERVKRCRD